MVLTALYNRNPVEFFIDDNDYDRVKIRHWYANKINNNIYIASGWGRDIVYLHRIITDAKKGEMIDHVNANTLDNRQCNLRRCNKSTNAQNEKIRSDNASGYKGVSWRPDRKKWRAYLVSNGKQQSLGHYSTKEEAFSAYCKKGREVFGEFFRAN